MYTNFALPCMAASNALFSFACIFNQVSCVISLWFPSNPSPKFAIIAANLAKDLAEAWKFALGNSDFLKKGSFTTSAALETQKILGQ